MTRIETRALRGVILAGVAAVTLCLAQPALARDASFEVGRWVGFGHQAGQLVPGNRINLDLTTDPAGPSGILTGVLSGLPAVQMPLSVTGSVTTDGRISLQLSGEGLVGFCDGSVRVLAGFGRRPGRDDVGNLRYSITDGTGNTIRGHINLIHLFGGLDWANVTPPTVLGSGAGSALPAVQDVLLRSDVAFDGEVGSSLTGSVSIGDQHFDMVGTVSGPGSLVMMCDGSVRNAAGQTTGIIGVLFTGGVRNISVVGLPAVQHGVGHYGMATFSELVPAIQHNRPGSLSFLIGLL